MEWHDDDDDDDDDSGDGDDDGNGDGDDDDDGPKDVAAIKTVLWASRQRSALSRITVICRGILLFQSSVPKILLFHLSKTSDLILARFFLSTHLSIRRDRCQSHLEILNFVIIYICQMPNFEVYT